MNDELCTCGRPKRIHCPYCGRADVRNLASKTYRKPDFQTGGERWCLVYKCRLCGSMFEDDTACQAPYKEPAQGVSYAARLEREKVTQARIHAHNMSVEQTDALKAVMRKRELRELESLAKQPATDILLPTEEEKSEALKDVMRQVEAILKEEEEKQ